MLKFVFSLKETEGHQNTLTRNVSTCPSSTPGVPLLYSLVSIRH